MKLFRYEKDGGAESMVHGLFVVEIKSAFSIVLLRFEGKSREAFHSHAFNAISWVLRGKLVEEVIGGAVNEYPASRKPVLTPRTMFHKVSSDGITWAISFRGPWAEHWQEYLPEEDELVTLAQGRKDVTT